MKYLLDTNVISEMQKPACNPQVKNFIESLSFEDMFLCVITIGELCYGIEKLPPCRKKHELAVWLYAKVPEWFRRRVIPLDMELLLEWGKIRAQAVKTMQIADSLIAAAAISRHLTLVTRNTKDFEDIPGINLINPWEFDS